MPREPFGARIGLGSAPSGECKFNVMGRLCCIGEPKAHFVIVLTRSNSVDSAKFAAVDEFRYDAGRDAYICPAGQTLKPFRHGR